MIVVSHPTGNAFVRALLEQLEREGRLLHFFTTVASMKLPGGFEIFKRRKYAVPPHRIIASRTHELLRLWLSRANTPLTRHETGWASIDAVYRTLDQRVSDWLRINKTDWVYAYEDGALKTFRVAKQSGIRTAYELPIAYWETTRLLLDEEAARLPAWEPTLGSTRDSAEKYVRKTEELELAERVICPSRFVHDSLPEPIRPRAIIAPFGSPPPGEMRKPNPTGLAAVLFAGSMSQRKGLADCFAAMKLLRRGDIQLVVMGSPVAPMEFYRREFNGFQYEAPRARERVLELMATCDLLLLPSIVEGRALVQQEAMSRGLPLLATPNAGGEDLIEEGRTGFLLPIRSPEIIAARIAQLADDRALFEAMSGAAREKAAQYTWESYASGISAALTP